MVTSRLLPSVTSPWSTMPSMADWSVVRDVRSGSYDTSKDRMVGTVSTKPASSPAARAQAIAACSAITRSLMAGEISLANSTVKAVSPQERERKVACDELGRAREDGAAAKLLFRWVAGR